MPPSPPTATRPAPPLGLVEPALAEDGRDTLTVPAPDLLAWAVASFVDPHSPFTNPDHGHLIDADLGVLWTNASYRRHGQTVAGQAEVPSFRCNAWQRVRQEQQLREWFGAVPDFVITLSAPIAAGLDDASFCALVEHELLHCGQLRDEFGVPRFSRETGRPIYGIRGHDVEEFVGVVERYGAGSAAGATAALVAAARRPPTLTAAHVSSLCGTCVRMAA